MKGVLKSWWLDLTVWRVLTVGRFEAMVLDGGASDHSMEQGDGCRRYGGITGGDGRCECCKTREDRLNEELIKMCWMMMFLAVALALISVFSLIHAFRKGGT